MSAEHNQRLHILRRALALSGTQRAAYLDQACAGDAQLRAGIEALLEEETRAGASHGAETIPQAEAGPAPGLIVSAPRASAAAAENPGDRIGHYKLLQQIGEGGFGAVWVAEQEHPVRRRVALKIIKLGMDTREVVARFEQERQALALMDHPHIAKVFDAGVTPSGRPFFVMELVRGVSITSYCDENHLTTRERIELFIPVCQAIQHAHQKGIIHRDIKPSNILVTINDGEAVPKVIDFGVAKATQGRLVEATVFTQFYNMIGTPLYMSPEQAEMTSQDIDTRSDIYSLGVLLYELLTGRTPIDRATLAGAGLDAVRRMIREVDPPRPSTRLESLQGDERTTAARRRKVDPLRLSRHLRGDLDWIVMKCLEKGRARRYETASSLAADLRRHLDNEIVTARPPTTGYLLRRLIRRHKATFVSACAIAASLLAGIAFTSWQAVEASRARQAEAAERSAAQTERDAARAATRWAEAAEAQATRDRDAANTARRRADDAARRAEGERDKAIAQNAHRIALVTLLNRKIDEDAKVSPDTLKLLRTFTGLGSDIGADLFPTPAEADPVDTNGPLFQAEVLMAKADAYLDLDAPDKAIPDLEQAQTLLLRTVGQEDDRTLQCQFDLARAYVHNQDIAQGLALAKQVWIDGNHAHGALAPWTLQSLLYYSIAARLSDQTNRTAATRAVEDTLVRVLENTTLDAEDLERSKCIIAGSFAVLHRHQEAISLYLELTRATEVYELQTVRRRLADAYAEAGHLDQAIKLYEEILRSSGAETEADALLDNLEIASELAEVYDEADLAEKEVSLLKQVVAGYTKLRGPDDDKTLAAMAELAVAHIDEDDERGGAALAAALQAHETKYGSKCYETLLLRWASAVYDLQSGQRQKALNALRDIESELESGLPENRIQRFGLLWMMAHSFAAAGRIERARVYCDRITAMVQEGKTLHPDLNGVMGSLEVACGDPLAAIPPLTASLRESESLDGPDHPDTAEAMSDLAEAHLLAGHVNEARGLYGYAFGKLKARLGMRHHLTLDAEDGLAESAWLAGDLEPAERHFRDSLDHRRAFRPRAWQTFKTEAQLGGVLFARGQASEAEPLLRSGGSGLLERRHQLAAQEHRYIREALTNLAALYAARGAPPATAEPMTTAAYWRGKLAAFEAELAAFRSTSTPAAGAR
jgi:serine/threonine protein kinase/tetratricopeptide (TPR) repeat protein